MEKMWFGILMLVMMMTSCMGQTGTYIYYSSFLQPDCSGGLRRQLDIIYTPCDSTYNGCYSGTLGECKNEFEAPPDGEFPNVILLYDKNPVINATPTCQNKAIIGWTYFNPRCGITADLGSSQTRCGDYGALIYSFYDLDGPACQNDCIGCVSANIISFNEGCGLDKYFTRDVQLTCGYPSPYMNYTLPEV